MGAERLVQTQVRTRLAALRVERGMTQAAMIRATGLSRATYLKLEQGRHANPPLRYLNNSDSAYLYPAPQ